MSLRNTLIAAAVAVAAGLATMVTLDHFLATGARTPRAPSPPVMDLDWARFQCKAFIARSLHDPRDAEWIDAPAWPVFAAPTAPRWTVRAALRARNAFGALRLTEVECVITGRDGVATLDSLQARER